MIISRTPLRISFTGGGSDLKEYYLEHGGCVISTSINKYIYLSMHPYFIDNKYFLKYSTNELVDNVTDIKHKIIREVFSRYGIKGVDFNSSADVPSGTGLGSSSTFTVGLINLCNAYLGKYMSMEQVAKEACEIEIDVLKEPIGKQDQYAAAVGGLNYIEFQRNDEVVVEKIPLSQSNFEKLEKNLMLFYLGSTREAGSILEGQQKNTLQSSKTKEGLKNLVQLTQVLKKELKSQNIDSLGEILDSAWQYKKSLSEGISNDRIDHFYDVAKKSGAIGGKLLGAGGSGFLLLYAKQDRQGNLINALKDLTRYAFKFDSTGSNIIYSN